MKKQNFEEAGSLELVKVNGSRFAAEVLNGNARINLTQMAKPFGESCKPTFWLRTDEAHRYLSALSELQKCNSADLIEVRRGGDPLEQGTWCRDYRIALRFAQWLSPEFSIKVDEAILGLFMRRDESPVATGAQWAQAPQTTTYGRRDESRLYEEGATVLDAMNGVATRRLPIPRKRSAELGAFYSELRRWVLKEDEAAVAELAGVGVAHVREVLAGRKPGYGVLCLLVEYATENRTAGRMRFDRSPRRRAEQVEELRLDFMTRLVPETNGMSANADMRAGSPGTAGSAASRGSERAQAPASSQGVIDFNGMEG